MNDTSRWVIHEQVLARQVGDECVILDLAKGSYFGLNEVGARVWALIVDGMSFSQICDSLVDEFDVERDELERDVSSILHELAENGLIHQR